MNQPSKEEFFGYMSDTFGYDFRCERSYELLKNVIREAKEEGNLKEFAELKDSNKRDGEIYRNYLITRQRYPPRQPGSAELVVDEA